MDALIEFRIPRERYATLLASYAELRKYAANATTNLTILQFWNVEEAARQFYDLYRETFREAPLFPYQKRKYAKDEIDRAEILHLFVWSLVEMSGKEFGTVYDESTVCPSCGTGATLLGDLILNLERLPNQDMVMTMAGEYVVSRRFRDIFASSRLTGLRFGPIRSHLTGRVSRKWSQAIATSEVRLSEKTLFGIDPFDMDLAGRYKCGPCHLKGARRISEAFVARGSWDGSDFAVSRERVGVQLGLYAPWPLLFISPEVYRTLKGNKVSGFGVEVAHLA